MRANFLSSEESVFLLRQNGGKMSLNMDTHYDLKKKLMPNKKKQSSAPISVEEFERLSKQYALDHMDTDPSYKWMKTKQPDDFNFDTYLKVQTKNGKIQLKEIHKDYRLSSAQIIDGTILAIITAKDPNSGLLDMELEKKLK